MAQFAIMTQTGRNKEAAALAGGTALTITEIAWGDGDRIPGGGETELLNEQGRKPVEASGTVPETLNTAFFQVLLDVEEGPFVIRETGLFDDDGDLIAIAYYDPPVNKPKDTVSALLRIHVLFSDLQNLILQVQGTDAYVPIERLVSAGAGLTGGGDLSVDRALAVDFASEAEALAGELAEKVISPATLAASMGLGGDGLPLYLELSNSGETDQVVPEAVYTRCENMVVKGGNAGALWDGARFTVDASSLGVYGVMNRININGELGEQAQTWKNGSNIADYNFGAGTGNSNVVALTHFVLMTTPGDYIEFYHRHVSGEAKTNGNSKAQIFRLLPYTPPA